MLRTILIDDEKNSLEALRLEIEMNCPSVDITAMCQSPEEGLSAIARHAPDLVFLDIQMPQMNGFEFLKSLDEIDFHIIFVTAFDTYSMQAIKVSALDYLLKPVDGDELKTAVRKVEEQQKLKKSKEQVDFLLTNLQESSGQSFSKIALPTMKGLDFVSIEDILYCRADGNYTEINTQEGEQYVISRTLSEFEDMLDKGMFFRSHKSYLVNLSYIKQYLKGSGGEVILKNGISIPVARARKEVLMDLIFGR